MSKPTVQASKTACTKCKSTERTGYTHTVTREIHGTCRLTGQPYTHTTWKNTKCKNCHQSRVDIIRENRV